jgi:hypothetical protein
MRSALALFLFAMFMLPAAAQDQARIVRPEIRKGDSWTYSARNILAPNSSGTYEVKVETSDGTTILVVGTRISDKKEFDATYTSDWNPSVGLSGSLLTPPPRFFSFPMKPGDARSLSFVSSRPRTNFPPTTYDVQLRVGPWEDLRYQLENFV